MGRLFPWHHAVGQQCHPAHATLCLQEEPRGASVFCCRPGFSPALRPGWCWRHLLRSIRGIPGEGRCHTHSPGPSRGRVPPAPQCWSPSVPSSPTAWQAAPVRPPCWAAGQQNQLLRGALYVTVTPGWRLGQAGMGSERCGSLTAPSPLPGSQPRACRQLPASLPRVLQ